TIVQLVGTANGALGNPFGELLKIRDNVLNSNMNAASVANAINSAGQIVGYFGGSGNKTAFVATVDASNNGTHTDLHTLIPANSGWVLKEATAINDSGQIVGYGNLGNLVSAFVLTPVSQGGACCSGAHCTLVASSAACSGGIYQGDNTVCGTQA